MQLSVKYSSAEKKDYSFNFSWLSKCFKKYSKPTSAAIIRLNPSHLSRLRRGAARRTEQSGSVVREEECMLKKIHLKAAFCAELLADMIVSDWSLKADFTLLLHHKQPSTANTREPDGTKLARGSRRKIWI